MLGFILLSAFILSPIEEEVSSLTGFGILDFEFAWTPDRVSEIFQAWGEFGKERETLAIWVDFLYIPCYGLFIFGAITLASRMIRGKWQDIGVHVSLTPLIAGVFDVIENIILLWMLMDDSHVNSLSPLIASISATIKFSLLIAGIAFFFIALAIILKQHVKKDA